MSYTIVTEIPHFVNWNSVSVAESPDTSQVQAEVAAGYAAFMADIDPNILTPLGMQGYRKAMWEYGSGWQLFLAGMEMPEGQTPAFVAGYRQAALEAEAEAIFAEMRSPFYSGHIHDEFVGLVP